MPRAVMMGLQRAAPKAAAVARPQLMVLLGARRYALDDARKNPVTGASPFACTTILTLTLAPVPRAAMMGLQRAAPKATGLACPQLMVLARTHRYALDDARRTP